MIHRIAGLWVGSKTWTKPSSSCANFSFSSTLLGIFCFFDLFVDIDPLRSAFAAWVTSLSQKTKYSRHLKICALCKDLWLSIPFWSHCSTWTWVGATGWTPFSRATRLNVWCSYCQFIRKEGKMEWNMLSSQAAYVIPYLDCMVNPASL